MKDSRNERLRAMFAGRGYYIAIALCLVAAGTIGYFALRERPVTVEQTDTPPVLDIQPVTPTQPVVKPAPVVIPDPVEEVGDRPNRQSCCPRWYPLWTAPQ